VDEEGYHPRISPVGAGLRCKCPRCGRGRLFHGYLTVAGTCESCGLDLEKADSGDGPAVFIIFILGFLVVPLALLLEAKAAPPYWVHVALWPVVILGGPPGSGPTGLGYGLGSGSPWRRRRRSPCCSGSAPGRSSGSFGRRR
jgi:uncharacterized protein (DUF983 family)